jgi:hypothetical protein
MSWISEEAERAKEIDDAKAHRDELYRNLAPGLWSGLKHHLQQDVENINRNEYLVEKRLGGRKLTFEQGDNQFNVTKIAYPAVYLRLHFNGRAVEVEREIVKNSNSRQSRKEREEIHIGLDEDEHMFFINEKDQTFGVADAAQILLTPFLRPESIQ